MSIPERPLLAPWYRLVEDGERLLFEHGQTLVILEGAAVKAFLPALLPLLDGTRTYDDLVECLGPAARPAVDLALEAFASNGLLVEGPDVAPGMQAAAHALASMLDVPPRLAAERLGDAAVAVIGSSRVRPEVVRLLRASGVGRVSLEAWDSEAPSDLAVVIPAPGERAELDRWNRAANARRVRWLPVSPYDGRFAGVGPLIVPHESCCFECFVRRRSSNSAFAEHFGAVDAAPLAARGDPALEAFVCALAAHLAVRWIGGRDTTLPGVLYAVEARPALSLGEHAVLRVPRCPVCSNVELVPGRLPWHEAHASEQVRA